jgi:hypothetical protein
MLEVRRQRRLAVHGDAVLRLGERRPAGEGDGGGERQACGPARPAGREAPCLDNLAHGGLSFHAQV